MNATYGRKCAELLPSCGPVGCLGKMLLASSIWGSTKRSLTWQKRDTLFSHSYFRLAASAHGMSASELLSSRLMFPTPLASDKGTVKDAQSLDVYLSDNGIFRQAEQGREHLEPEPFGGGVLPYPGGVGGLPLHPETHGLPGQGSLPSADLSSAEEYLVCFSSRSPLMHIIQKPDSIPQILSNNLFHFLREWTRIADRSSFPDTACKSDRICSAPYKLSCPQNRFFRRAPSTVDKSNYLNLLFNPFKGTCLLPDSFKIRSSRTIILRLHASDNSNLQLVRTPFLLKILIRLLSAIEEITSFSLLPPGR